MDGTALSIALLAAACASAGPARAAGDDLDHRYGWYLAGSGGWTSSADMDVDSSEADDGTSGSSFDLSLDPGYTGQGSVGIMMDRWRGEVELGYRANDASDLSVNGAAPTSFSDGDFSALTIAFNVLYDFPIVERLGGYVGGGGGIGIVDCTAAALQADGTESSLDADTSGLVLQFLAGLDVRLTSQLHLTAGYRMWVLLDADVKVNNTTGGGGTVVVHDSSQLDPVLMHSVEIGLRYEF